MATRLAGAATAAGAVGPAALGVSAQSAPAGASTVEQIWRAVKVGVGAPSPAQVRIVTADPDSEAFAAGLRGWLA